MLGWRSFAASRSPELVPRLFSCRFVYENKNMSSPKVYVLQPWIANLLVNYEQLDANENLLAGQVLRVGTKGDWLTVPSSV